MYFIVSDDITRSFIFDSINWRERDRYILYTILLFVQFICFHYPQQTEQLSIWSTGRLEKKLAYELVALNVRQQYYFKVSVKTILFQKWAFSAFFSPRMMIQETDTQDSINVLLARETSETKASKKETVSVRECWQLRISNRSFPRKFL